MKKIITLCGLFVFLALIVSFAACAPSVSRTYEVAPEEIYPGGSAQVIITITNSDLYTSMEDVDITLTSKQSVITVIGARNELGDIPPGAGSSAAFRIRAAANANPGPYALEAKITYRYENGSSELNGGFVMSIPIVVSYRSSLEIFAPDTQITPGATENLPITISNTGKSAIHDIILTVSPASTYVYPVGNVRNRIASISPGEDGETVFTIRASDSAVAGIQPITVTASYIDSSGSAQTDIQHIGINVVDAGTEIVISKVESMLQPGKEGMVKITVSNVGDVLLENLYFSLESESEEVTIVGSNEKLVESLDVGEEKEIEFMFDVSGEAEARPVKASLEISYQREGGKKEMTDSKPLGIRIEGGADLRLIDYETDIPKGELEVDLANYGNKDAEAVKITAVSGGTALGTGFADSIKSNKHKVFRFDMPSATSVDIIIEYKDYDSPSGQTTVEETLNLEVSDIMLEGGSPIGTVILLIIIVAILFWYFAFKRKKRTKIDVSKYKAAMGKESVVSK